MKKAPPPYLYASAGNRQIFPTEEFTIRRWCVVRIGKGNKNFIELNIFFLLRIHSHQIRQQRQLQQGEMLLWRTMIRGASLS